MTWYDSHIHTCYSPDSDSRPSDVVRRASRRGLSGLCFTDHVEFAPGEFLPGPEQVAERFRNLRCLQRESSADLEIAVGVEVGYYPGRAAEIRDFLQQWPFDFVIGAVHVVGGLRYTCQSAPASRADDYYRDYLASVREMLAHVAVDAVGHFDLPRRHGPALRLADGTRVAGMGRGSPHWPTVRAILDVMVQHGVLMEVNASGLRQPPEDPYPAQEIMSAYHQRGGRLVTVGSDSHRPQLVGVGREQLRRRAREAGISRAAWFRDRQPRQWSLV